MFDENNNPKPEGFLAVMLTLATLYYVSTYRKPMKEIYFKDFMHDYLLKNNIKHIELIKDRRAEVFNYRAEVTDMNGETVYMTLNSLDQFL